MSISQKRPFGIPTKSMVSLPYIDQRPSFWKSLNSEFQKFVEDVYFPLPKGICGSGRPEQPSRNLFAFLERAPFKKTVLLNPILIRDDFAQFSTSVLKILSSLNGEFGISSVTIADIRLAALIHREFPDFEITASTLLNITKPEQLTYLIGIIDVIVPSTTIARDVKSLSKLRKNFSGKIKLIVNEGCLLNCPYRIQHFFEMNDDRPYTASLCSDILEKEPWLRLTGAWIPPQFLYLFEGLYDSIKLAGRVTLQDPKKYIKVLKAYITRTEIPINEIGVGPAGPLTNIPISEDFYRRTIYCKKHCFECSFCRDYYEQHAI